LEAGSRERSDYVIQAGQFACQLAARQLHGFLGIARFNADLPVPDAHAECFQLLVIRTHVACLGSLV
jgi:hypothetical protein